MADISVSAPKKSYQLISTFEFTFHLMTVGLLNTTGFCNLKYQDQEIFTTSRSCSKNPRVRHQASSNVR